MSSEKSLSRRDLFAGAGVTAGVLTALGGGLSLTTGSAQAAEARAFGATSLAVEINGQFGGFCTGARGGGLSLALAAGNLAAKSSGQATVEPLTLSLGPNLTSPMEKWISSRDGSVRDISLVLLTVNFEEAYRLILRGARVAGISFPTLDAASTELFTFDVVLVAESATHQVGGKGGKFQAVNAKQQAIRKSSFQFFVQGLEPVAQFTFQVKGLSAERAVGGPSQVGARKFLGKELGQWTASSLTIRTGFAAAAQFYQWQGEFVQKGGDRQAQLQILSPDLKSAIATVDLQGVLPTLVTPPFEVSGAVEATLACADMKFNLGGFVG